MLGTNINGKQLPNCLFCSHKVRITSKPRLYDPPVLTSHLNFTTYVRKFFSFIFISHTAILLLGNLFFQGQLFCELNERWPQIRGFTVLVQEKGARTHSSA